jgi:two-component system, NtrC family, response regulator PilR
MTAQPSHFSLLVVDDEPDLRTLYELTLLREGYDVEIAGSVEDALLHLKDRTYSALITDMRLPDGTGLDLLRNLEATNRREKAIVITAYGSAENAVEALKAGAYDYLTKPVDLKQFRAVVASALGRNPAAQPSVVLSNLPGAVPGAARSGLAVPPKSIPPKPERGASRAPLLTAMGRMAGHSPAMEQVRTLIDKVARSMAPVLVNGESGTGKELVARAIHEVSPRTAQPFIAVNCSAIPDHLLEAEFFGYRKGAFTGANEDREGFFQAANGGTLFLDEIGDLPLPMQSKLLRAIQERSVRPVGAVSEQLVNVRILSATHKDLAHEVRTGLFRQDLYYRLNVIQILVPPLRERLDDLPQICQRVLDRIALETGAPFAHHLTDQSLSKLGRYRFPGNVRELENLLQRAVALCANERIDVADLDFADTAAPPPAAEPYSLPLAEALAPADAPIFFAPTLSPALPDNISAHLDEVERDILNRALERHHYNRTAAGISLGLSLRQMRYRMARLGVQVGGDAESLDEP